MVVRLVRRGVAFVVLQVFQRVDVAEGGGIVEQHFGHFQRFEKPSMRRAPVSR
jgi:hypothetical protein